MNHCGSVTLVGAGPGDPELLTLGGARAIAEAEVLIYDRLVAPETVALAPADCETIYVGKTPDHHSFTQEQINQLLVEKAQAGHRVVRLKGGDPYVFGRGGEEGLALVAADIPFSVISGVTSAVAGPASAAIPITHRGVASLFTVITGHEDPQKSASAIHWDALAHTGGTLVFLMGMKNLPLIVGQLKASGMDGATPAAIIERATLPHQRVATGTLDTIEGEVERLGLENPAVIVIGDVVAVRSQLLKLDNQNLCDDSSASVAPLAGLRVAVTRARRQASKLSSVLEAAGATVLEFPMIRLEAVQDSPAIDEAIQNLQSFDWVVFDSPNGVRFFTEAVRARDPKFTSETFKPAIAAVGSATAEVLTQDGFSIALMPSIYTTDALLDLLKERLTPGASVLLVLSEAARPVLREGLKAAGFAVSPVVFYTNSAVTEDRDALLDALRGGFVDAFTFTCSSAVRNFFSLVGGNRAVYEGLDFYSIGPITTQTLKDYGIVDVKEAQEATIASLAQRVIEDRGRH